MSKKNKNIPPEAIPYRKAKKTGERPVEDFHNENPVWRFSRFDIDGSYEISRINMNSVHEAIIKLGEFESMNWTQIESAGHGTRGNSNSHYIKPNKDFTDLGIDKFKSKNLEEYSDDIFSLRLSGTCRFIGIRDGNIFNIIWYDVNHSIVKSDIQVKGKVKR